MSTHDEYLDQLYEAMRDDPWEIEVCPACDSANDVDDRGVCQWDGRCLRCGSDAPYDAGREANVCDCED